MDADPLSTLPVKPTGMLDLDQDAVTPTVAAPTSTDVAHIAALADVWSAAEALASPELVTRWDGVKRLIEYGAPSRYPLIAYLLATRITEPDIALRARVVEVLGNVLRHDEVAQSVHPSVFGCLIMYLASMRTRAIYSLLQVAMFDTKTEPMVAALLSYCSYAGGHLAEILADRDVPAELRWQAVHFISRLGFLDALPTLERLVARMEMRIHGRGVDFDQYDEANLLLEMRQAIEILRAP